MSVEFQVSAEAADRSRAVQGALENEFNLLRGVGVVDCKLKAYPNRNSDTEGLAILLTNALRLRREGRVEEVDLHRR